jgi:hypothetical protein
MAMVLADGANPFSQTGTSEPWAAFKARVVKVYALYAQHASKAAWNELSVEEKTTGALYEAFAWYLFKDYTISTGSRTGEKYLFPTAMSTVRRLLYLAKGEGAGGDGGKLFFTCLDSGCTTESANWLRGLQSEIQSLAGHAPRQGLQGHLRRGGNRGRGRRAARFRLGEGQEIRSCRVRARPRGLGHDGAAQRARRREAPEDTARVARVKSAAARRWV